MGKTRQSFAVRLSLRFMFILTFSILLLSVAFLIFVNSLVQSGQTEELKNAESVVFTAIKNAYGDAAIEEVAASTALTGSSDKESSLYGTAITIQDIPYYMTYIAYYADSGEIIATNDPFLPLLADTSGKAVRHIEEDFFFDGDLDILYYASAHPLNGEDIITAAVMNMDNNTTAAIFNKLPPAILLMALPVLILSFLVSLLITKNTINPVVRITKAARTMTTDKLDSLLPLTGRGDEIDELSKTFNELFAHIKADFERERQFSSDVSHELNTPLTVISGQTNLLLRWGKDNPEQLEKSLLAIKNEAKSMHSIIDNLLQMSRIESGRIKPNITEVDVRGLFERVKEEFAAVAPDTEFEIECRDVGNSAGNSGDVADGTAETVGTAANGDNRLIVATDAEMLHQILTVFVSNSMKFCSGKCTIRLSAVRDKDNRVTLEAADDGLGITESALPHIFERFYRADEARTRNTGGSGLGLSIAKTLADALGAEISARNAEPHGAIFTLQF